MSSLRAAAGGRLTLIALVWMLVAPSAAQAVAGHRPLSGALQLSVGHAHSCAIVDDGGLYCWGSNADQQLGVSDLDLSDVAVRVDLPDAALSIAAGYRSSCAVLEGGQLLCWGDNQFGQLGTGSSEDAAQPTAVSGIDEAVEQVAVGLGHACALGESGAVYCWGSNSRGELGVGSTTPSTTPLRVEGLPPANAVSLGTQASCALTRTGGVSCWGNADAAWLVGGEGYFSTTPKQVVGLTQGVAAIATTEWTRCATMAGGEVRCWGADTVEHDHDGASGALLTAPTPVSGLGGRSTIALAAGTYHACFLSDDGRVRCRGSNFQAQRGNAAARTGEPPTLVSGAMRYRAIAAGQRNTCAITTDGTVECWGLNDSGQIGDRTHGRDRRSVPVRSEAPTGVVELSAGSEHSCLLTDAGRVWCWGFGHYGQLGLGDRRSRNRPTEVTALGAGVRALAAGHERSCAINVDGAVLCWGYNASGGLGDNTRQTRALPTAVVGLDSGFVDVGLGVGHACALHGNGSVFCWGNNSYGELGFEGGRADTPVEVTALDIVATGLAVGAYHSCAHDAAGAVRCWGRNDIGQLGIGSTIDSAQPKPVDAFGDEVIVQLQARNGTCARAASGRGWCWGAWVGDGDWSNRSVPVELTALGPLRMLDNGCAIAATGLLHCWGNNHYGQLGDGSTRSRAQPAEVAVAGDFVALSTGRYHSCAVDADGGVYCWGWNELGSLGNGQSGLRESPRATLLRREGLIHADDFEVIP